MRSASNYVNPNIIRDKFNYLYANKSSNAKEIFDKLIELIDNDDIRQGKFWGLMINGLKRSNFFTSEQYKKIIYQVDILQGKIVSNYKQNIRINNSAEEKIKESQSLEFEKKKNSEEANKINNEILVEKIIPKEEKIVSEVEKIPSEGEKISQIIAAEVINQEEEKISQNIITEVIKQKEVKASQNISIEVINQEERNIYDYAKAIIADEKNTNQNILKEELFIEEEKKINHDFNIESMIQKEKENAKDYTIDAIIIEEKKINQDAIIENSPQDIKCEIALDKIISKEEEKIYNNSAEEEIKPEEIKPEEIKPEEIKQEEIKPEEKKAIHDCTSAIIPNKNKTDQNILKEGAFIEEKKINDDFIIESIATEVKEIIQDHAPDAMIIEEKKLGQDPFIENSSFKEKSTAIIPVKKILNPVKVNEPAHKENQLSKIGIEKIIEETVQFGVFDHQDFDKIQVFITSFEEKIKALLPTCDISIVGSLKYKLFLTDSCIDMQLNDPKYYDKQELFKILHDSLSIDGECKIYSNYLEYKSIYTIHIYLNTRLTMHTSDLILRYNSSTTINTFIYYIKIWGNSLKFDTTGYLWTLIAIFYLINSTPSVLKNLQLPKIHIYVPLEGFDV